jgi:hypothetical protein
MKRRDIKIRERYKQRVKGKRKMYEKEKQFNVLTMQTCHE